MIHVTPPQGGVADGDHQKQNLRQRSACRIGGVLGFETCRRVDKEAG